MSRDPIAHRAMCRTCYRKKNGVSGGSAVIDVLTIISAAYAIKEWRKDWKEWKRNNGIGEMSLYTFHKKHKAGTLDEEAQEIADKLFAKRIKCKECGKRKHIKEFSYPH